MSNCHGLDNDAAFVDCLLLAPTDTWTEKDRMRLITIAVQATHKPSRAEAERDGDATPEQLLELAGALEREADVSLSTIKRDVLEGRLATTRIRGCVKVHPQDWEAYLQRCRSAGTVTVGKSESAGSSRRSAELSAAVAMLPNLSAALSKGSKITALEDYRPTRSRKRSTAG